MLGKNLISLKFEIKYFKSKLNFKHLRIFSIINLSKIKSLMNLMKKKLLIKFIQQKVRQFYKILL